MSGINPTIQVAGITEKQIESDLFQTVVEDKISYMYALKSHKGCLKSMIHMWFVTQLQLIAALDAITSIIQLRIVKTYLVARFVVDHDLKDVNHKCFNCMTFNERT